MSVKGVTQASEAGVAFSWVLTLSLGEAVRLREGTASVLTTVISRDTRNWR